MIVQNKDGKQFEVIEVLQSNLDYIQEKSGERLRKILEGGEFDGMFLLVQPDGDYSLHRLNDLKENYTEVTK